jgi:ABC-type transport system involved in multi-copper enzyme maturation permease subunit
MSKLMGFEWRQNKRSFWVALAVVGLLQAIPALAAKSYINEGLSTFEEWVSGQPYMFFLLLLGFFSISWAFGSIVKERDRQTAEFMFTLPRSRTSIYLSKWLAQVLQVVVIAVLSTGIVLLIGKTSNMLNDPWAVSAIMLAGFLTSLAFMGIGFALTPWLNSERGALSIGIGIVSLMFLFNILSSLNENMNWLASLSLFNLFDAISISQGKGLPILSSIGALVLFIAGSFAGWVAVIRRDL